MKVCPPLVTYYGLRYFASQASVRSTTHRCRPSLLLFSLPFRAILLLMPRFLRTWQHFLASSASSARSEPDTCAASPTWRLTGSIASTSSSNI